MYFLIYFTNYKPTFVLNMYIFQLFYRYEDMWHVPDVVAVPLSKYQRIQLEIILFWKRCDIQRYWLLFVSLYIVTYSSFFYLLTGSLISSVANQRLVYMARAVFSAAPSQLHPATRPCETLSIIWPRLRTFLVTLKTSRSSFVHLVSVANSPV
jgi:hypothetical protein